MGAESSVDFSGCVSFINVGGDLIIGGSGDYSKINVVGGAVSVTVHPNAAGPTLPTITTASSLEYINAGSSASRAPLARHVDSTIVNVLTLPRDGAGEEDAGGTGNAQRPKCGQSWRS